MKYCFGIDIGGTTVKIGLFSEAGEMLDRWEIPTRKGNDPAELLKDVKISLENCMQKKGMAKEDILGIGMAAPGPVTADGVLQNAVNIGWGSVKRVEEAEKSIGISPVRIGNDARVAALGEAAFGAGKEAESMLMVTLGTGVGGGAFLNGEIYAGSNYAGLEVGHIVIEKDGRLCNCGRKGCFERYAAASALTRDTQAAMKEHPESALWKICPDIEKVNAKTAFDGQKQGDKVATDVVNTYIEYLACGLVNLINIFQPEVVCLGGGVSNERQYLLDLLQPHIDREDFARNARERTKIVIAKFRNDAGIIGAAMVGVNND